MVIVASIYLRFYIEVGVGTFLPTPTPPKITSDSDSTVLAKSLKCSLAVVQEVLDCLTLKMKALHSFELCGTTFPVTQCHNPEDLNLQQHCCENLKSCKSDVHREKAVILNRNICPCYHSSSVIYPEIKLCHICTTCFCNIHFNIMFMFTLKITHLISSSEVTQQNFTYVCWFHMCGTCLLLPVRVSSCHFPVWTS
jgi:hypothetical protein